MYSIKSKKAVKVESVTFSELGMQENDIEEILRCSIDMLCDDEESMLLSVARLRMRSLAGATLQPSITMEMLY